MQIWFIIVLLFKCVFHCWPMTLNIFFMFTAKFCHSCHHLLKFFTHFSERLRVSYWLALAVCILWLLTLLCVQSFFSSLLYMTFWIGCTSKWCFFYVSSWGEGHIFIAKLLDFTQNIFRIHFWNYSPKCYLNIR